MSQQLWGPSRQHPAQTVTVPRTWGLDRLPGEHGTPGLSFGQTETQSFCPTAKDLYPPEIFPDHVLCTAGTLQCLQICERI